MEKKIENIKENRLIAFVSNLGNENDLFLNDNILLRRTSDKEKEDFLEYNHFSEMASFEVNHCFEFRIDDKFMGEIDSSRSSVEVLEFDVLGLAMWHLLKMGEAINISKEHPCEILRIDLKNNEEYIPDYPDKFWLVDGPKPKYFEELLSIIEEDDIETINSVFSLLLEADTGQRDYKKYWWIIPVDYYNRHDESIISADQIIDLTIGLESLLSYEKMEISYRLRLRSSLYLYYIDSYNPEQVQRVIKIMYDLRSAIVHGTISLDEPDLKEITYIKGTSKSDPIKISIVVATRMLRSILRIMLLDALLNHTEKSKGSFIEFIDSIWYHDADYSKMEIIDDGEIFYSYKDTEKEEV